jgi:C2 domain-containing protein
MRRAFLVLALAACGGPAKTVVPPPLVPPPPRPAVRLQVTIVDATIDGRKPDGTPWDDDSAPPPPALRGALAAYLAGHPELEGTTYLLGEPVDVPGVLASAKKSSAPDPLVFVELGKQAFRTTLAPGQFHPTWRFPFLVSASPDAADLLRITVVDWDGPAQFDVVGEKLMPVKDLFTGPVIEVGRFGSVARLVLEVAPAPEASGHHRAAVAGRDGWTDAGVSLVAGQEITIRAAGEVCSKPGDRSYCAGPEGQPRTSDASLPGFEPRNHAGLVAAVGDTRFFVGRELRFVAPSSGPLLLRVNDADTGNNSGELEVDVEVR